MPFLTFDEFKEIAPIQIAQQACQDPNSFEAAERTAAQRVIDETGIAEPALGAEATAPAWVKAPVAYIILYNRIGYLLKIDPELRAWSKDQYTIALETLAKHKGTPSARVSGSTTSEMEGLPTW
jgi:hypothetical protein